MLKRNKELQELVKKQKEEEKKIKTTVTPKATAVPTSQNSNLVGGVSINNASMMEKSRLRRNEAPKTSLLDSLSSKKNTSNWYDSMLEKKNKATNSEGYTNTGKTYGDYYYQNYSEYKNTPIYKKDNKYYMYLDNKYQPLGKIKKNADNTITTYGYDGSNYLTEKQQTDLANGISVMTSANTKKEKLSKEDKKALLEAKKQGYKEPEGTKTKDYQKAESKFKKLQKEYNLTDEQLQEYIDTGKLSYKNLKKNLVTKSMINAKNDAEYYRKQLENGKIKKYEKNSNELTAEQRLDVETAWMNNENLSNKEKKQRLQNSVNQNIKNNKISQEATYQVGQGYLNRPLKENQSPLEKILYGTADVSANLVHGIGNFVEDVGDTLTYGVADVASKLGAKKFAKAAREQAQEEDTNTVFEPFEAKVNKGSILGQKSKSAVQSIGHTLPIMAAGSSVNGLTGSARAAVGATSAMTFTSSFGDAKTRALNSGASNKEATQYAFVQATAETISEQIFDGIPGAKSAGWADNLVGRMGNSVTNYLGTRAGKIFEKTLNVSGEGFEEILSNVLSATGNDIVHYFDKNYKYGMEGQSGNILEDMLGAASSQESKDAFVSALLTSAILNGGQAVISTQTKNTILDAYAKDNNITRDEAKQILTDENGNINYEKIKEQINNQQGNEIDTPQEVKQEVQQEVIEDVQEKPNTQPTISESKINEIVENVTKNSKIEYNQKEIADLKKTLYDEVEKLGGKIEKSISNKLEERLSGDKLLNAQDLINEVKSVGAKVDDNGYITLYHQTTPESAQKIKETGKMISKERDIFFSTSKDAQQSNGRGNVKLEFKIPAENLILDDIFSDNADLKISLDGKNELDVSNYIVNNEIDNSLKQQQLDIIKKSNPMQDDYHTGIRTIEDIKTLEETLNDSDYEGYDTFNPDLTRQDIENAIKKGTITVYSSYPIENGVFVSPSKMEAESYSGNGKVYSKEVSINDVAWIDPTQGQYAKVQNDTLNFKQTKGNIPINEKLLNKYNNVKEMMNSEINNYDGKVDVKDINQINELKDVDLSTLNKTDVFNLAKNIFDRYNNKNLFNNNGNEIMVSHADIKESIKHIYNENQIKYLKEHLQVFSDLGDIIESATLSSQGLENKKNMQSTHSHNNIWNYYLNGLKINGETYLLEFDVVSRDNGENHYRVQRIQKTDTSAGNTVNNSITPTLEASASINNDTTKTNKSQIAPSQNSMQQNEKNTPKEKNTIEERIPDVIEVRQSPMDKTSLNKLSKNMAKELYLNNSQTTDLKDVIQDFYRKDFNEYSKKDLFNSIKDKFSEHNEKIIADDSLNDIQQQIRNTKIKVPEYIKEGIGDYNNLRQSNFGKTKLGNTGIELDSFYDELASDYPSYFDPELSGEDQLLRIIDIANMDNSYTEKYTLDDDYIKDITEYIDESIKDYKNETARKLAEKDIKEKYKQDKITDTLPKKITRKEVRQDLLKEMGITEKDLDVGKHINQIDLNRTDPIRVNEKIFGAEVGQKINNATINKTKHNEAERTRFLNKERNDIKELGIKARSKESAAVQKYGEKEYVNKYGETVPYGDKELMAEFKDAKTQEKIKRAASMLRNKYDKYIVQINDVLTDMGYKPIEKRKDYMRHFQALNDVFSRYGIPLNKENLTSEDLPTDINGLTDQFKPGKQYFASAMKRMGIKTTYDAITGIDGYLEGASNLIYHTEDIQRYRALSEFVRNTYGAKHGFENLENLTNEEAEQRIKDIQNNKLSQYAAWLDEQANSLANKKGKIDRGFEETFGRKSYAILNAAKKQVGSNMTGYNIRSAMTNFASAVQGASKTSKISFAEGTISAINNLFHKDNLVNKSDFLTSRFGSDMLAPKLWQKLSSAGQVFMNGTDYFTANQIWRSKYFENLHKGMSEENAIKNADDFAARIMGDRSKGATAQIFNSKTLGLLTQFQLEVNNQWSSLIHDNKMDIKSGNKAAATVLFQTGQLFALSHLFNMMMKTLTGRDVMIDPIEMLKKIFDGDDDDDKNKTIEERTKEVLDNIVDNLPFANLITPVVGLGSGGRIPISEAFKGVKAVPGVILGTEKGDYGQNLSRKQSLYNLIDSVFYWFSPTGYGQAKKTTKGLKMFINDKEIKGSYSQSGNLRFPVSDTLPKKIQAALFGENASSEAQEYFNGGRDPLKENQQKELKALDIPISDYWKIKSGLSKITNELKGSKKTKEERMEIYYKYIDSLDIGKDKKNILKKLQYKTYYDADESIKDYISSLNAKKSTKQDLLKRMGLDK